MDVRHFDALVRVLSVSDSRRGLVAVLAALPVLGGLLVRLSPDEAEAKDRRRRRKQRHKQRKNRGSRKGTGKKTCTPEAITGTCAGKCGDVTNNCGTVVDCGSCDCDPPCGECLVCEGSPGQCFPVLPGTPCGAGPTCADGIEQRQDRCDSSGICQDVAPISCDPFLCSGNTCATSCASDSDCVPFAFCSQEGQCTYDLPPGEPCTDDDECISGNCCGGTCQLCCDSSDCSGSTPVCLNNVCVACTTSPADCPNGTCCNSSTQECVANCPGNQLCAVDNICTAPCDSHAECGGNQLCVAGICQECDAFPGSPTSLQTAITNADPGSTLYVCPGLYAEGGFLIDKSLTIIGAGDGAGETRLQGIVDVDGTANAGLQVTLRDLRVLTVGFGVRLESASLLMERCTVRRGASSGTGVVNIDGALEMRQCAIVDITTGASGGAIQNSNGSVLLRSCLLEGNTAAQGAGIFTGSTQPQIPSSVELRNTEVRGNTANHQTEPRGAGIWNFNGTSAVTISNDSVICDNDPIASQCDGLVDTSRCLAACPD